MPVTPSLTAWLALVNSDRQANGAGPVTLDSGLMIAAWDHAVDMGVKGYAAHFDPHGFSPVTRALMLGSMLQGAENIAFGQADYAAAEQVFMAEKAMLPNRAPADCAGNASLAGHYCNIIQTSHDVLGLAIVDVPGSPYVRYFDQEFGDLNGDYDTTVIGPEPPLTGAQPLTLIPSPGDTFTYEYVQTMPAPTPIDIATLNADPTCASMCPAGDPWYPTGNQATPNASAGPVTPTLTPGTIVFLEITTNRSSFFGASVTAGFWGGGTVAPDSYGASALTYRVP